MSDALDLTHVPMPVPAIDIALAMPPMPPKVFVSYRRTDSAAAARWIAKSIEATFGSQSVFIDVASIRPGKVWGKVIDDALCSSTVLIAVIGERWLSCQGQDFKRRIDEKHDWVRKEIEYAIVHNLAILPVLLTPATLPSAKALPSRLARLPDHQAFQLRHESWEQDLHALLACLKKLGFPDDAQEKTGLDNGSQNAVRYPSPKIELREYSTDDLRGVLQEMPDWRYVESALPGAPGQRRAELHRNYTFASFEDAVRFMHDAVPGISQRQHHPRWENIWRTVSVWLSTWDIGYKPSVLDAELARFLDAMRKQYR